jgi:hypothetical protein
VLSGALIGAALGVLVSGAALLRDGWRTPVAVAPPAVSAAGATELPRRTTEVTVAPPVVAPSRPTMPARGAPPQAEPQSAGAASVAPSPSAAPVEPLAESAGAGTPMPPRAGETEIQLLDRAQAALGANPGLALTLTDEHRGRFPSGLLGQEREVLAMQALMRLGRVQDARTRAARFEAAFPGSAHLHRIEAIVNP